MDVTEELGKHAHDPCVPCKTLFKLEQPIFHVIFHIKTTIFLHRDLLKSSGKVPIIQDRQC